MLDAQCKKCRRAGQKLFLKGDRCSSPKCAIIKRPYAPGIKTKRRKSGLSEYGKQLQEKQKLKFWYGLRERQFKKYVKETLAKGKSGSTENVALLLLKRLESRLDNVVFALGFAASREQGRQLVNHGHFLVNGKRASVPSFEVKKGDIISIRPTSLKKNFFNNLSQSLKKHKTPSWMELNADKLEGKVAGQPALEEVNPPAEIPVLLEFYSR